MSNLTSAVTQMDATHTHTKDTQHATHNKHTQNNFYILSVTVW